METSLDQSKTNINRAKVENLLSESLQILPSEGKIQLASTRMLMFNHASMGFLRKSLIEQLGECDAQMIFAKFGYESALHDYNSIDVVFPQVAPLQKLEIGPIMHGWCGLVSVIPEYLICERESSKFFFKGRWINSYEAASHLEIFGRSESPVCFSLTGYGSAWCSQFFGMDLLEIETKCVACGDDYCQWEIKPWKDWGPEAEPWKKSLTKTNRSVISELSKHQLEIRRLTNNFEYMLEKRVAENSTQLRALCHDIHAPLQLAISNLRESLISKDLHPTRNAAWSVIQAQKVISRFQKLRLSQEPARAIRRKAVRISKLVSESLRLVSSSLSEKAITVKVSLDENCFSFTDKSVARDHILTNILSNSIKFSTIGSEITISAQQVAPGQSLLTIEDRGIGLPTELMKKISESAQILPCPGTSGEIGTGHGLSIALYYAKALGGQIHLESKSAYSDPKNCGTTALVVL